MVRKRRKGQLESAGTIGDLLEDFPRSSLLLFPKGHPWQGQFLESHQVRFQGKDGLPYRNSPFGADLSEP